MLPLSWILVAAQGAAGPDFAEFFDAMDSDRDGVLQPFEVAAALLSSLEDGDADDDGGLSAREILQWLERREESRVEEIHEIFRELDEDDSGALELSELDGFLEMLHPAYDTNRDDAYQLSELEQIDFDDPRTMLQGEITVLMDEFDEDGDGLIPLAELPRDFRHEVEHLDENSDGKLTKTEIEGLLLEEMAGATFEIEDTRAHMSGTIGPSTPGRVLELIALHPEVDTIVMLDVPGSMDDHSNLRAARWVRAHGLGTEVPDGGMVASGGTDFFLAGARRAAGPRARFGIHSWAGPEGDGSELPRDHESHDMFLEYYEEMGIPEDFYWRTLEAAPAEDIHWMDHEELEEFEFLTEDDPPDAPTSMRRRPERQVHEFLCNLDPVKETDRILALPEDTPPVLARIFDRYTRVKAPNDEPIHILAQSGWRADQIVKARKVLEHMLTSAEGTRYGHNKAAIAVEMARRHACLVLFDDEPAMERAFRGPLGEVDLQMQDLRANECPVEGDEDYMRHHTRDASFEEILHLVHDAGIRSVLKEFDSETQRLSDNAELLGLWEPWPEEDPDSFRNEYIAAIYDNYLDLWTVEPTCYEGQLLDDEMIPDGTSHFGRYQAGSRARLKELDPQGYALVESFFPPHLTYQPDLPANFEGTFSLTVDSDLHYTTKSQHLRAVRLTGDLDSNLIGNDHNNQLRGNDGNNRLEGLSGADLLSGGPGRDIAVFQGPTSDYTWTVIPGGHLIRDDDEARDGTDVLHDIEVLEFTDGQVDLTEDG